MKILLILIIGMVSVLNIGYSVNKKNAAVKLGEGFFCKMKILNYTPKPISITETYPLEFIVISDFINKNGEKISAISNRVYGYGVYDYITDKIKVTITNMTAGKMSYKINAFISECGIIGLSFDTENKEGNVQFNKKSEIDLFIKEGIQYYPNIKE